MPSRYLPAPTTPLLGDGFFDPVDAAVFPSLTLRFRNQRWADRVGLGNLDDRAWLDHFGRFSPLADNLTRPLALRYHGYQFHTYNPQLGDGRGFLFAQLRDPVDGRLLDLGTKGSGTTPWSRGGDGRLTLKGGVREVLATEMLSALGVRTSQSFSLIETGESLQRNDEPSPTRASVLVRLSHSHVRFGSFERHHHHRDVARLERLLDFSLTHYFPALVRAEAPREDRAEAFFRAVIAGTMELCGQWMAAGFVHGVLNTDNMNITGESFDYGPYRFLPTFDPAFTAAYFDHSGLYAYGRQPDAVIWSLERLAEALSLLCPLERLTRSLVDVKARFMRSLHLALLHRLGLAPRDPIADSFLASRALCVIEQSKIPFDRLFFDWFGGLASEPRASKSPVAGAYQSDVFRAFRELLVDYAPAHPEALTHPYFSRAAPCSMLIDEIETIWSAIADRDDWSAFETKVAEVREMGEATSPSVSVPLHLAERP